MKFTTYWKALVPGDTYPRDFSAGENVPESLEDEAVAANVAELDPPKNVWVEPEAFAGQTDDDLVESLRVLDPKTKLKNRRKVIEKLLEIGEKNKPLIEDLEKLSDDELLEKIVASDSDAEFTDRAAAIRLLVIAAGVSA